jgi:hypothetical protein
MTDQVSELTPLSIMKTLSKISKEIDAQTTEIARCDVAAVKARVAYNVFRGGK